MEDLGIQEVMEAEIIRRPTNTRPIIWQISLNGKRFIVKDYRKNGFFFRNTIGRLLIWREEKAYRKLSRIKGIPKFYGNIKGLALVIEKIEGVRLGKIKKGTPLPKSFFDQLESTVRRFHKMGVVHCDLKKANNIILGTDGRPYIIDWGAAIHKEEFDLPVLRLIYKRFLQDDNLAIIKHKLRFAPQLVTERERRLYEYKSPFERLIRKIRDFLLPIFQKIV